ncbi:MAG TPA: SusC/RagA family TonB-linked outer membrane protein [Mucilaginibacter sp.]|jgi:TonB-linked SusC/RagA family outer membrane protein|nr:SusC/RagA family TonB-linked outer membrane protein [Mucilaginibacter sp.]
MYKIYTNNGCMPPGYIRKFLLVMKITTFLLFVAFMQVSAAGLAQKLTLVKNPVTLRQLFLEINKQTSYNVIWSADEVNGDIKINAEFKDSPLLEVLDKSLANTGLTYSIENKTVLIKTKQPTLSDKIKAALNIPINVSGKVTDTLNTPLIGANVTIKGTNKSTVTGENGEFTISAERGDVLTITYIGYKAFEITVSSNTPYLNIALHTAVGGLKEVVVNTGYQRLPKERATGSFAFVDSALFNKSVSPDVISRLEGNVPGLVFNHNTVNSALGNYDISIQGHNTLFSNDQPLIVLDNFAYDGSLQDINPNDVESITILKDAAAASIWGVRSGNGVIVITTKKGKRNQKLVTEVNANVTIGDKPNLFYSPNFLDANDYINVEEKLFNSGYYNSIISNGFQAVTPVVQILANEAAGQISATDANNQINALRNQDVRNDLSQYFYRKSVDQQYSVNFNGGGDKSDYYFSAGEDHGESNLVGNNNNRITIKSNYNFYPVKNLQLSAGINYSESTAQNNSSAGGLFGNLYPYAQLVGANGTPLAISTDLSSGYKASTATQGLLDWQYRPLAEIGLDNNTTKSYDNLLNFGVKYTFLKDISAQVLYQYEKSNAIAQNDNSVNTYYARNLINEFTVINSDGSLTYNIPVGGILQQNEGYLTSQQVRGQLNYSHSWSKDNELAALGGVEIRQAINQSSGFTTYGYDNNTYISDPNIDFLDYFHINPSGSSRIPNSSGYSKTINNFISYYSNIADTYKDIYTLSLSARIDHSNLFGVSTNQKAVPLYSAGFAWALSKESFYNVDWLPFLKPRITYGYSGNINTSATAVQTIQQYSGSPFSNLNYAMVANPGNPNLQWEKNRKIDFALEFGTKNNVITGYLEYYLKNGINLFGSSPLPPSTGLTTYFGNVADTKGHGGEIAISSKNLVYRDFRWTSNFTFNYVIDKVTKYDVQSTPQNLLGYGSGNAGTIVPIVGANEFGIYSYKWGGLTHETGDPQGYLNGQLSTDWTSILANTPISGLVYNGPSRPTTTGSFRNTFSYDRLSLSFNILYEFNFYFRKTSISDVAGMTTPNGAGNADYTKAWQKPGDEAFTYVPSMAYPPFNPDRETFYNYSSVLVDKGDNIRLKDISLSYTINKNQWRALPFSNLQIYSYINNIAILWRANKDHLDPDLYSTYGYPNPLTISFGVKANF